MTMEKKYRPGWGRGVFIIIFPTMGLFFGAWDSPHLELTDPAALFFLATFWISGLEAITGSYVLLNDTNFCVTSYFFIRQCLRVDELTHIWYIPTWKIGQTSRSLFVIKEKDSRKISVHMTNVYREETLAMIARDLKALNSKIVLDEHAEALMKKHAGTRA